MNTLLKLAISAAIDAGKCILNVYASRNLEIEIKRDKTPVTKADKQAHQIIIDHLSATEIPIISEEDEAGSLEVYNSSFFWLVDPLDGTKDFINGTDEFGVNIALIKNGIPVLGVIFLPAKKELLFGTEQEGSKYFKVDDFIYTSKVMNEALKLPFREDLCLQPILLQSRMYPSERNDFYAQQISELLGKDVWIMEMGSTTKYVEIAKGKGWFYPRLISLNKWDLAAGDAIIRFSGGQVINILNGEPINYSTSTHQIPPFLAISSFVQEQIPLSALIELFQKNSAYKKNDLKG
jgi:3'(2'), 5'-bisphosphate nucleotidase